MDKREKKLWDSRKPN